MRSISSYSLIFIAVLLMAWQSPSWAQQQFSDGTPDSQFSSSTNGIVFKVAAQEDGKILIIGNFTEVNGVERLGIARFKQDGTLDETFSPSITFDKYLYTVVPYPNGKILIGGSFTEVNGVERLGIARLNDDGTLDTSFNTSFVGPAFGTPFFDPGPSIRAITLQPDGKILIAGSFKYIDNENLGPLARLNGNGELDLTFDTKGVNPSGSVFDIVVQPDGKIIAVGAFDRVYGGVGSKVVRYLNDGTYDTTFIPMNNPEVSLNTIFLQGDGKMLLAASSFTTTGDSIQQLNSDGSLSTDFTLEPVINRWVTDIAQQADGKLIIAGHFQDSSGEERNRVARFYDDGRLDNSFTLVEFRNDSVNGPQSILPLTNGDIILGGLFSLFNGVQYTNLLRLTNRIFSEAINLSQFVGYGVGQDIDGSATLNDTATSIILTGNTWKAVEVNYQVTENTVLEFDFNSESEGEIHGIGLDDDLSHNTKQSYQIHGIQSGWGIQSKNKNYQGGVQRYRIRIGQNSNMLGLKRYLSFINDDDRSVALGNSTFSNVRIYEDVLEETEFVRLNNIISYGAGQDVDGRATLNDTATSMTLTGNTWKAVEVNYQVTENTVLEFDFNSESEGEIHGIGLDDDLSHNTKQSYQIHGIQSGWGIQSENNNYQDGVQRYRIRIGQNSNMLGLKRYLSFINDDDRSVALGNSTFSNIRIYEDSNINGDQITFDLGSQTRPSIALSVTQGDVIVDWNDGSVETITPITGAANILSPVFHSYDDSVSSRQVTLTFLEGLETVQGIGFSGLPTFSPTPEQVLDYTVFDNPAFGEFSLYGVPAEKLGINPTVALAS